MPDWRKLVGEHLAALALDPQEREEVIEELAAHFDETFADLRRRGLTEENATSRCLDEVRDWDSLRKNLQTARRKENVMSNRVTQLWLPGLVTFALSVGLLALTEIFGPKPWLLKYPSGGAWGQPPMAVVYIPWLLALPLVGAAGAFLSHRAGGSRRAIFSSIIFPVVPFLAAMVVVLPVSLAFDHFIAHNIAPMAIFMALLGLVLAPGVALLAGGLPAQLFFSRRLPSRGMTSN
jgi:hypothetical protein